MSRLLAGIAAVSARATVESGKATVVATDLRASNGIVHVTDAVSIPS
jgi:uncharacterized surface protein with fasciclin (FAS1) repeats